MVNILILNLVFVYRCFADWDDICKTLDMNAHIPKPVAEEKEAKTKDEEKIAEKEGDKIGDDKDKVINSVLDISSTKL